jgi:TolB-like protein
VSRETRRFASRLERQETDGLRVTAASSVVAQTREIPAIARQLDVQIVFDGTVRQNKNQLRIMSRIVNAGGFQLWSERFETEQVPMGLSNFLKKSYPCWSAVSAHAQSLSGK